VLIQSRAILPGRTTPDDNWEPYHPIGLASLTVFGSISQQIYLVTKEDDEYRWKCFDVLAPGFAANCWLAFLRQNVSMMCAIEAVRCRRVRLETVCIESGSRKHLGVS
jgi:hypothetical protein